jgi:16S rRNA processing protein RimM
VKSINRKDFSIVGFIAKTHGTKGELKVIFDFPVTLKEWVFVELQQKPVPFFLEHIKQSFQDEAIIKLNGINTRETAEKLKGLTLLLPKKQIKANGNLKIKNFLGYDLIDETIGFIGKIEAIEEYPKQIMLFTTYKGNSILIPAIEPILTETNDDEKVIYIKLPEGFLEALSS